MLQEKPDDSNVNDQLQMLLQEAGLDSVPIDPTSLEALKSLVANDNISGSNIPSTVRATDENRPPLSFSEPPLSEVKPNPAELKRFTSELTVPSAGSFMSTGTADGSSVAVAGFVKMEGATPAENKILQLLADQTRLLVAMQRRIDDLTVTVSQLTRGDANVRATASAAGVGIPSSRAVQPQAPASWVPVNDTPQKPPAMPPAFPPAQRQQPVAAAAPNNNNNAGRGGLLMAIRHSPLVRVARLFWVLRRRHVQELDGGLIFKILFMMAILTARVSSSSKKHGDAEWHNKFAILVLLVVTGFLMQTGYLQYVYLFFVKENYPERIFNGEDVEDIIRNPNGQNNPNQNNNNNNPARPGGPPVPRGQMPPNHQPPQGDVAGGGWRNTFLGGIIPEADQGGVAGALKDVALLFGSFLMSIFPMWAPEGPPQRAPPPGAQQQVPPPDGLAAGPGAVRPPRDVLQPADDSDDEN